MIERNNGAFFKNITQGKKKSEPQTYGKIEILGYMSPNVIHRHLKELVKWKIEISFYIKLFIEDGFVRHLLPAKER